MTRAAKISLVLVAVGIGAAVAAATAMIAHGFSARDEPTAIEAFIARRMRELAIPRGARDQQNPIRSANADVLAEARAHFADHCAICHANDGSGDTPMGRNLYPKVPDMRQAGTQSLSDGELFYIIHNGIRLTGMPAWGGADPNQDQDSWKLVHFIRHLPQLTSDELANMKALNPKSPHDLAEEEAIDDFLRGTDTSTTPHAH